MRKGGLERSETKPNLAKPDPKRLNKVKGLEKKLNTLFLSNDKTVKANLRKTAKGINRLDRDLLP